MRRRCPLPSNIAKELRKAITVQGEKDLKKKGREFANEVQAYAKSIAPVDEGDFKESIKVRAKNKRGRLPSWEVYSNDPIAHLLEGGTDDTPEFAVFGRTAFKYGGTLDNGESND